MAARGFIDQRVGSADVGLLRPAGCDPPTASGCSNLRKAKSGKTDMNRYVAAVALFRAYQIAASIGADCQRPHRIDHPVVLAKQPLVGPHDEEPVPTWLEGHQRPIDQALGVDVFQLQGRSHRRPNQRFPKR